MLPRITPEKSFKEKYVSLCEEIFSGRSPIQFARDRGIQGRTALTRFWDELLLLKVNQEFLAQCVSSRTEEELRHGLKPIINEIFAACVTYLSDENFIRVAHALESLAVLTREIFRKRFSQQGVTITLLLAGSPDNADTFFRRLISSVGTLLARDNVPVLVKSLGLRLCLTILTATDNVNSNPITSYFFSNNILDHLASTLSVKLSADRKRLEVDAVLVLLLLLLWRESENAYVSRLASPTAPLQVLLHTTASMLSQSSNSENNLPASSPSSAWEWDSMVGYMSGLLGFTSSDYHPNGAAREKDCDSRSCGLLLLYVLVYHSPAFKSNQIWPAVTDDQAAVVGGQSLCTLWAGVFKTFIGLCRDEFLVATMSSPEKTLRAKLALTILRCIFETPVASHYLWHCDADLSLKKGPPGQLIFKSLSCDLVEKAANMLADASIDPELTYRAAVLVPLALKTVKAQAWQLPSSSLNSTSLWQALVASCARCGNSTFFQKPGGAEAAELVAGILEWCLVVSQDIFEGTEETEALHATVMSNINALEQLSNAAASSGSPAHKTQLVNVAAVKYHYEVQIAALGVRGQPNFQQALAGVKKKGVANLKLKAKHAGPGRVYIEGTPETRLLNSLTKLILSAHRNKMLVIPKLENEAI
ncbi:uncharacterized protein LOC9642019 [Selaginella moellendorffii]|uniref:uncharacterized protein LOC9642019 n=1 Tax=Selaginella moellendorffii TaxID=88036 RepID=UPI000D1C5789|nr:uncharacterized protein LOC9642019 [Selaginella moellendorffii]|eukprot:XP_024516365.1 uncharacterized protein LOC9642019 [Selaginella moellendorffii]